MSIGCCASRAGPLGRVFTRLDARITVSDAVIGSLRPYFRSLEFTTIPNGIDTGFFTPDAEPIAALRGKRTIVFVGRFDPRNGVKHMIGAFVALRRTRGDVRLVVVGDGPLARSSSAWCPSRSATTSSSPVA